MSRIEPGRGIFCGLSGAGVSVRAIVVGSGAAAGSAVTGACPEIIAKKAFCAASLPASCDGPGVAGSGGRADGRIGFKSLMGYG